MQNLKQHGVQLLQLDVTDSKSVRQAVDDVIAAAGRIDVLVNNAGELSTSC
jgi:NAD(P)-dependent dehydrogenase (short-subunit alcohol dehydrogenase family)